MDFKESFLYRLYIAFKQIFRFIFKGYYKCGGGDFSDPFCLPESANEKNSTIHDGAKIKDKVFCSVFAPCQVKKKGAMLVQVYLHIDEYTNEITAMAVDADPRTKRCKLRQLSRYIERDTAITVEIVSEYDKVFMRKKEEIVWHPPYVDCSFVCHLPDRVNVDDEIYTTIRIFADGVLLGRLTFSTIVAKKPSKVNAWVNEQETKKVFISYSRKDEDQVKMIAEGYKALGDLDYFFDRHSLNPGDLYENIIFKYIDHSDLFILCWSENAEKSEWVKKVKERALKKYFETKGREIHIYPLSIPPKAELPDDMKETFSFGEF